jgi:hypothetical protein
MYHNGKRIELDENDVGGEHEWVIITKI